MRKDAGFTLIELIIIIAIVGALTAIAVPNFMTYQSNFRLTGALSSLRGDLVGVRMLAIKGNKEYQVVFSSGGYLIIKGDSSTGSTFDANNPELTRNFADEYQGVTAAATANPVFSPKGTVTPAPVTITLQGGQRTQTITIFIAGKIKVN